MQRETNTSHPPFFNLCARIELTFPSDSPLRFIISNETHYIIYFEFTFNSVYEFTITFPITGDIDYNGLVNIFDVVLTCGAYLSTPSDPRWNPHCDVAEDFGIIDIFDVVFVASHYGDKWD